MLRILILLSFLTLSGCATIDDVFGPPFASMSDKERLAYCVKWPEERLCEKWVLGGYKK